jgi:hypothetical protein
VFHCRVRCQLYGCRSQREEEEEEEEEEARARVAAIRNRSR